MNVPRQFIAKFLQVHGAEIMSGRPWAVRTICVGRCSFQVAVGRWPGAGRWNAAEGTEGSVTRGVQIYDPAAQCKEGIKMKNAFSLPSYRTLFGAPRCPSGVGSHAAQRSAGPSEPISRIEAFPREIEFISRPQARSHCVLSHSHSDGPVRVTRIEGAPLPVADCTGGAEIDPGNLAVRHRNFWSKIENLC